MPTPPAPAACEPSPQTGSSGVLEPRPVHAVPVDDQSQVGSTTVLAWLDRLKAAVWDEVPRAVTITVPWGPARSHFRFDLCCPSPVDVGTCLEPRYALGHDIALGEHRRFGPHHLVAGAVSFGGWLVVSGMPAGARDELVSLLGSAVRSDPAAERAFCLVELHRNARLRHYDEQTGSPSRWHDRKLDYLQAQLASAPRQIGRRDTWSRSA